MAVTAIDECVPNGSLYVNDLIKVLYRIAPSGRYQGCQCSLTDGGKTLVVTDGLYVLQGHIVRVVGGTIPLSYPSTELVTGTTAYLYIILDLSNAEENNVSFVIASKQSLALGGDAQVTDPEQNHEVTRGKYSMHVCKLTYKSDLSAATAVSMQMNCNISGLRVDVGTADVSTLTPGNTGSIYVQY